MTSNSPEPLQLNRPKVPLPGLSPLVLQTYNHLGSKLREIETNAQLAAIMQEGYIAGLYAAAAAINSEDASARQISETAGYIERQR